MSLHPGSRFGPYEILAPIGAGGMGEVYRARDTRLDRDVAIKVLPAAVASDPVRLTRFDREARLLAALNHPHIATIHGVELSNDVRALVMELVEGPTLEERIERGPVPVREALRLASQIAEALDAAHERGVVHRDLKPANIKVTTAGQVKVLDFGLAKALGGDTLDADFSRLATATAAGTRDGVIVGTTAYMSPEQARGQPVDKRTDIWAFGCVLYEMLTGKLPFAGKTLSDTIAAILDREPDWSVLPVTLPPAMARLLRRCLEKNVSQRLRDIGDTKIEFDDALTTSGSQAAAASALRPRAPGWVWLVTTIAVFIAGLLLSQQFGVSGRSPTAPAQTGPMTRFIELLPQGRELAPAPSLAIAPDGRRLAYIAIEQGTRTLYVRDIDEIAARALAGTKDADEPFFSPDGRWIGFFADGKLKKVAVAGGAPLVLCDATTPRGGTWLPDNSIIFAPSPASVLLRVRAEGGNPEPVSTLDRQLNEGSHRWPHVLPGRNAILYAAGPTVSVREWIESHIVAQSLGTDRRRQVVAPHGTFPHFAPTGHLLYVHSGTVYAQSFDPDRLEVAGNAVPILERVTTAGGINGGSFQWAISGTGTMAYVPGFGRESQVVRVDRAGREQPVLPPADYHGPRLSPDGRRLAVTLIGAVDSEIWIYDLVRGTSARLTSGGRNLWPVWSPDGTRVAYASSRHGSTNVYWKQADGSGIEEQLTSSQYTYVPHSWSPDGKQLVLTETDPERFTSIVLLPLRGDRTLSPFRPAKVTRTWRVSRPMGTGLPISSTTRDVMKCTCGPILVQARHSRFRRPEATSHSGRKRDTSCSSVAAMPSCRSISSMQEVD